MLVGQCYHARLLGHKYWLLGVCVFTVKPFDLFILQLQGAKRGPWRTSNRQIRVMGREIEAQWIRCRVREIRTLPQERQLNSSSPCMVKKKKTPPKATGSQWELSKYESQSHWNSGPDYSMYEYCCEQYNQAMLAWGNWYHESGMKTQLLQFDMKFSYWVINFAHWNLCYLVSVRNWTRHVHSSSKATTLTPHSVQTSTYQTRDHRSSTLMTHSLACEDLPVLWKGFHLFRGLLFFQKHDTFIVEVPTCFHSISVKTFHSGIFLRVYLLWFLIYFSISM